MTEVIWLGVMIPIVSIIATAVVVVFALERFYRIRKLEHEAKLRAIEKGYDVPMHTRKSRYPFAWPLVFGGFGLALLLMWAIGGAYDETALGFGLVLFFIGAGLFASRFFGVRRDTGDEAGRLAETWRSPGGEHLPRAGNGENGPAEESTQHA
ncbi:MAG: hypothetical protein MAG453_00682 [Calditrichaeota bacterium]|nr:hypothetical protein [Calditrichota bacterium]